MSIKMIKYRTEGEFFRSRSLRKQTGSIMFAEVFGDLLKLWALGSREPECSKGDKRRRETCIRTWANTEPSVTGHVLLFRCTRSNRSDRMHADASCFHQCGHTRPQTRTDASLWVNTGHRCIYTVQSFIQAFQSSDLCNQRNNCIAGLQQRKRCFYYLFICFYEPVHISLSIDLSISICSYLSIYLSAHIFH